MSNFLALFLLTLALIQSQCHNLTVSQRDRLLSEESYLVPSSASGNPLF